MMLSRFAASGSRLLKHSKTSNRIFQLNCTARKLHINVPPRQLEDFDLVVIGSGPAGQKAAVSASKFKKKVCIIDMVHDMLGGVCVNTGTIPSKTLREAILYLSGWRQKGFYGRSYAAKEHITFADLTSRVKLVLQREKEVIKQQMERNEIQLIDGLASFIDPHTLTIQGGEYKRTVRGKHVLIACGTRPAHDPKVPVDGRIIYDSDQFLRMHALPKNLIVVGAGVIGMEYASMLGALNIMDITIVDGRQQILEFVDQELLDTLTFHMRDQRTKFRLGEKVKSISVSEKGQVVCQMQSGKKVIGDSLLYAVGRQGNTDSLNITNAGLQGDDRGRLKVNAHYQTAVPHIYAAGDVIGYPALASSSSLQGRLAAAHMFNQPYQPMVPELIPFGIYTIPELSMVGKTEQQLTKENIPYEYGLSRYSELAKGMMQGDSTGGLLKILFHSETKKILGVHVIGEAATEIVHIGQAAIAMGAPVDYFKDNVFNFPTFSEAYQVAALDGLNKLL